MDDAAVDVYGHAVAVIRRIHLFVWERHCGLTMDFFRETQRKKREKIKSGRCRSNYSQVAEIDGGQIGSLA
jgi:hypothetical protein